MACDNCKNNGIRTKEAMTARVDAIIDRIGTSRRDIIPLLQALQDEFSYLPSDALLRVYERTEIDRAQLISVSTFYSQFRHVPYGKHTGTACHVKGANNVYDAFRRELKMEEDRITTADQEYSIEKIACLGCCALAPVVQIDEKIYGHVQPGRVNEVLDEFRIYNQEHEREEEGNATRQIVGEIRLGMENCCQASGTSEIYQAGILCWSLQPSAFDRCSSSGWFYRTLSERKAGGDQRNLITPFPTGKPFEAFKEFDLESYRHVSYGYDLG